MKGGGARNRKPASLKILRGNPGKRPIPKSEPRGTAGMPTPPRHLTLGEAELWAYYAPLLSKGNVLTLEDRDTLAQFCEARDQVIQIKAQQAEPEYRRILVSTMIDGAGNERVRVETNPLDVQRRAWTDKARLCAQELGLSPMSRARVTTTGSGESEQADPLETLLRAAN